MYTIPVLPRLAGNRLQGTFQLCHVPPQASSFQTNYSSSQRISSELVHKIPTGQLVALWHRQSVEVRRRHCGDEFAQTRAKYSVHTFQLAQDALRGASAAFTRHSHIEHRRLGLSSQQVTPRRHARRKCGEFRFLVSQQIEARMRTHAFPSFSHAATATCTPKRLNCAVL